MRVKFNYGVIRLIYTGKNEEGAEKKEFINGLVEDCVTLISDFLWGSKFSVYPRRYPTLDI